MKAKSNLSKCWVRKVPLYLVFIGLLVAQFDALGIGTPPIIAVQPLGLAVQNGGTALLTTTATSLTPMDFVWCFNGEKIANPQVANVVVPLVGTVSTLTLSNLGPASAGTYSVWITNGVGSVQSSSVTLIVLANTVSNVVSNVVNILSAGTGMTTNGFNLNLSGPAGSNYVIEASADLKSWVPISTNAAPSGTVSYTDTAAKNIAFRYYRAKVQ